MVKSGRVITGFISLGDRYHTSVLERLASKLRSTIPGLTDIPSTLFALV